MQFMYWAYYQGALVLFFATLRQCLVLMFVKHGC